MGLSTLVAVLVTAWLSLLHLHTSSQLPACTALSIDIRHQERCQSMNQVCIDNETSVLNATHHGPNAYIDVSLRYYSNITGLHAFCRLRLETTTDNVTGKRAQAGLWLSDRWNGRLLALGQDEFGPLGAGLRESSGRIGMNGNTDSCRAAHGAMSLDARWS